MIHCFNTQGTKQQLKEKQIDLSYEIRQALHKNAPISSAKAVQKIMSEVKSIQLAQDVGEEDTTANTTSCSFHGPIPTENGRVF